VLGQELLDSGQVRPVVPLVLRLGPVLGLLLHRSLINIAAFVLRGAFLFLIVWVVLSLAFLLWVILFHLHLRIRLFLLHFVIEITYHLHILVLVVGVLKLVLKECS
jgi:hypothetical protein